MQQRSHIALQNESSAKLTNAILKFLSDTAILARMQFALTASIYIL
jgi:hypothetical protein